MKTTGADAIMRSLIAEGVETIFGYPGGAIMPAYDALYHYADQLRHILVRHEQAAAHAAQGFARMTGEPGVCVATSGPGATNLITGIADAMMDSVPMVCITGQVTSSALGTDAFQETDVIGITIPITKWNYQITSAEEVPEIFAKAFHIARSGRPGPVLIDITKDAKFGEHDFKYEKINSVDTYKVPSEPDIKDLQAAAELINNAKSPLIYTGHGVLISKAEQALVDFSEKSGIPVASTLHGLSSFPSGHPNFVGMLGMHGNYGPNYLSNDADVIIAVGMRFDDRVTGDLQGYLKDTKVIHIEIDPAEIGKVVQPAVAIVAEAKASLEQLLPMVEEGEHSEWIQKFSDCYKEEYEKVIAKALEDPGDRPRMVNAVDMLSEKTAGEAVIVADVGQHQMMSARYYKFNKPNSWVTSGGLGTMGFALPAAMGCKVASPDRPVIAIIGDGCFQMTIQELATIAQENLPVKVVVLNNNFLGMVRQWQEMFFERRYSFTEMTNPDFVAVSKGFGIESSRVESNANLSDEMDKMLATPGPYVLEVVVEREDNVFPMVPSGAGIKDVRLD